MAKQIISKIKESLGDKILEMEEKSFKRAYLTVDKKDIPTACKFLFEGLDARFIIASALDTRSAIEILYHFSFDRLNKIVSLRTFVDKDNIEIDSIAPIVKAAEWIEREIHELLGVNFKGHPNLVPLLMAEDWPEGKYPLRKD